MVTAGTGESGTVGPVLITPSHGNVSEQHTASVVVTKGMGESGAVGPVSIAHSHGTASVSEKHVYPSLSCHVLHPFLQVSTLDARSRVSASRADLSATYEHRKFVVVMHFHISLAPPPVLKTRAVLEEAKSRLKKH